MPMLNPEDMEERQDELPEGLQGGMHKFARLLLEDELFPEDIKEHFPAFFDKETALSFIDKQTALTILNQFDDTVTSHLMSKPETDFSFEDEVNLTQARSRLLIKLQRAVGGPRDKLNERTSLMTQIRQMIAEPMEEPSGGVLNKVKSGLGKLAGGGRR